MTQSPSRAEIFSDLRTILSGYIWRKVVNEETPLYEDGLWLCSEDVSEMLEQVNAKFGTSFEGLYLDQDFPGGSDDMGIRFVRLLERIFGFRTSRRKTMTVGHLVDVIQRGAWFEPPSELSK